MARAEATRKRQGSALLLLALFGLGLACLALPEAAESGVATAWVRKYNPAYWEDGATAMALDSQGNVCVSGFTTTRKGRDFLTIKYSPQGQRLWARRYNGPKKGLWRSWDQATAITVDGQDNIFVTGGSEGPSGYDGWATIKYSPGGQRLWVRRYNEGNLSDPLYLAVDAQGNAYVTGPTWDRVTLDDIVTIKYSPEGRQLWIRRYNGPGNSQEIPVALALDKQGNVYVAGGTRSDRATSDYLTIKYSPDGEELWVRRYNGPGNIAGDAEDFPRAIAADGKGNVYVTGESVREYVFPEGWYSSYLTVKCDTDGRLLWAQSAEGYTREGWNSPSALAVDQQGNVHVTGVTHDYHYGVDSFTIKYDAAGRPLWSRLYNGPKDRGDGAAAITLDGQGNVYITGWSDGGSFIWDFHETSLTIKYSPDGVEQWVTRYQGIDSLANWGSAIAVAPQGQVYITGGSSKGHDYVSGGGWLTIKYLETSRQNR